MTILGTLLPNGKQQFIDSNGIPLVGGKVYFYIPTTLTPKNTWQNPTETILNTNPVILDGRGQAIIYGTGQYRQILKDSSDNLIWDQLTNGGQITPTTLYFNVKDYGAVGNGTTDDTIAVQAAITALTSAGIGTLFFPAGTFRVTSSLTLSNLSMAITGEGEGVSVVKFDAAIDGFSISQNSDLFFTNVMNISFYTTQQDHGNALTIDYSSATTSGDPIERCAIYGLEMRGTGSAGSKGWHNGISLNDVINTRITATSFIGYQSANTPAGSTNAVSAIKIDGADNPAKFYITQFKAFYCQNAIEITGTTQGVYIQDQCNFAQVDKGVYWHEASPQASLFVNGCQIDAFSYGVYGSQVTRLTMNNNFIHKSVFSNATTQGVYLTNCIDAQILGNILFSNGGTGDFDCIVLDTGAIGCQISNNILDGFTTGLWFKSGSTNNIARGNSYQGSYTTIFTDAGTNNAYGKRGALVYLNAPQSIANSTDTGIAFTTVSYDTDGFFSGGAPTRLTIPAGVIKVKLSCNLQYDAGTNGGRNIQINKNGSGSYVGRVGESSSPANSGGGFSLNGNTAEIFVAATDYFELHTSQSEGSSLNAQATNTWLSIEVIE